MKRKLQDTVIIKSHSKNSRESLENFIRQVDGNELLVGFMTGHTTTYAMFSLRQLQIDLFQIFKFGKVFLLSSQRDSLSGGL